MPDELPENVKKWVVRDLQNRVVSYAQAVLDSLPEAETALVTFVGPDGPVADAHFEAGSDPQNAFDFQTDANGQAELPVGAPAFTVDTIGLPETSVPAITSSAPFTVTIAAASMLLFLCCLLFGLGSANAASNDSETPNSSLTSYPVIPDSSLAFADEPAAAAAGGGNVRRAALKMFLRRQATKAFLRGDRAKAKALRAAIDDDDVLDSVVDSVHEDAKLGWPVSGDGAFVDQVIKLLSWLIDHADAIIAIVMKIIPLFAEPPPAVGMLDVPAGWCEPSFALAC